MPVFRSQLRSLVLRTSQQACGFGSSGVSWNTDCAGLRDVTEHLQMANRMRVERELPIEILPGAEHGLSRPGLILIAETGEVRLTLRFGALAPDGLSRYVFWDERQRIVTVPDFHYRNLSELLQPALAPGARENR